MLKETTSNEKRRCFLCLLNKCGGCSSIEIGLIDDCKCLSCCSRSRLALRWLNNIETSVRHVSVSGNRDGELDNESISKSKKKYISE